MNEEGGNDGERLLAGFQLGMAGSYRNYIADSLPDDAPKWVGPLVEARERQGEASNA